MTGWRNKYWVQLFYLIWLVAAMIPVMSCRHRKIDAGLAQVNLLASENPVEAMRLLDSIGKDGLDSYNSNVYDFLKIKTADKAYIQHQSDSLFRKTESYFSTHKDDPIYPEVLYYGGRVYSDLGDYPRALKYFQQAIEVIPDDDSNLQLRLNAFSQTGRLLNKMRLYQQAIPYLEECVKIDSGTNNTQLIIEDLALLATVCRNNDDYAGAENHLKKALFLSQDKPGDQKNRIQGEIALLKFYQGESDSALMLIRGIPEKSNKIDKDYLYAGAARIYYAAGIMDTAYMYALRVKDSNNLTWRRSGYKILLNPGVKEFSHPDTLDIYLKLYLDTLEKIYNNNQNEETLLQNTLYNYSIYEKDNLQLINKKNKLTIGLCLTLILVILTIIIILGIKYRTLKIKDELKESLVTIHSINNQYTKTGKDFSLINGIKSLGEVKEALKKETVVLSDIFTQSIDRNLYTSTESYKIIQDCITREICISDEGWITIFKTIEEVSPGFTHRLNKVSSAPLSDDDLRLLHLIKMGINATNVSKLMAKSKSTITYRRKKLRSQLNMDKISLESLDRAIQLI